MSNPQAQGSLGPQQPQQGGGGPSLLKADDLARLQCLSPDQKQKYRPVLENFWQMLTTKPQGSPEHNQAHAKLREWSQKLIAQERTYRGRIKQQQAQLQQQGQGPSQPNQQVNQQPQPGHEQQKPAQLSQQQPVAQPPNQPNQPNQQANRPQAGAQVNPDILKHVDNFPYVLQPGGPVAGTPEGNQKIKEMRNSYLITLTKQERASNTVRQLNNMQTQREQGSQEIPQDWINRKKQAEADYNAAKRNLDEFRKKQQEWRTAQEQRGAQPQQVPGQQQSAQAQPQQPAQPSQPQQPQPAPQNTVKQEPQIKVEGGQPQQFGNMGVLPQQPQQNVPAPAVNQHPNQQQNQTPYQPPRPQINPTQANAHAAHPNNSPHPQSAASNAGPVVPHSLQAAVSAAQRSYSNADPQRTGTPMQSGQGNNFHAPGSREREQLNNPKMPIPRTLNVSNPSPVSMGQARPTMSGPTNGAPGPMGQPVIAKYPPFQLEGEGDRVLNKRKLDELVRQVTGGSEDALTPEVEESMLQLADEFVDTVITSACKLSKLRESSHLEIRDLQLVLERNYNIRIPGYASDEVRTVRKLIPAPGWTQKMNAVQAAKVMGGKTDI